MTSHRTRGVEPILDQCWATVCDAGRTLNQHRVNPSCLRGMSRGRQTVMNKKVAFSEYSLAEVAQYTQTPESSRHLVCLFCGRVSLDMINKLIHSFGFSLTLSPLWSFFVCFIRLNHSYLECLNVQDCEMLGSKLNKYAEFSPTSGGRKFLKDTAG